MDIVQLAKSFHDFEVNNKLFKRKIDSTHYWDFIRYSIYIELMINSSNEETSYIFNKKPFYKKIISFSLDFAGIVFNSINAIFQCIKLAIVKKKYDIVFYSAGDKKKN